MTKSEIKTNDRGVYHNGKIVKLYSKTPIYVYYSAIFDEIVLVSWNAHRCLGSWYWPAHEMHWIGEL